MGTENINLPEDFKKRMKDMLKDEYEEFEKAYEDSNYHGLRINPLKADSTKNFAQFNIRPVPWCKTGFYYDETTRPGRHPFHHAGAYYIQEPSAMLVGELALAKPGMRVLDLCAAPGGKSSHLAGEMKQQGVLVANEIVPQRSKILSQNIERMGVQNCIVTNESPDRLAANMPLYFDLIVVDTPCSGEGMFRRDEIARNEWSLDNVEMCAKRDTDILEAADRMLKPGGKMVYSTCTFAPVEDEQMIDRFLESHPQYFILKVDIEKSKDALDEDGWVSKGRPEWTESKRIELSDTFRLWPHRLHGEGHFAAVLVKGAEKEDIVEDKPKKKGNKKDNRLDSAIKLYEEFAKQYLTDKPKGEYVLYGDNLYLLPEGSPVLKGLKVERPGLMLGEIKKDRFEPGHSLAMSLGAEEFKNVHNIEAADEAIAVKYLCGESLTVDEQIQGWTLVTYDGVSMGFGKGVGNIIKNHYPKGLRIRF